MIHSHNTAREGRLPVRIIAIALLLPAWFLFISASPGNSQMLHDLDGNGRVDAMDLFEAASRWESGEADNISATELQGLHGDWHLADEPSPTPSLSSPTPTHTGAPTPTETPGAASRILSLPENLPAAIVEIAPGAGVFTGTVDVPLHLSDTTGVATIEVSLAGSFADSQFRYGVSIQSVTRTALVAGFQNPTMTGTQSRTIRITGDTPLGPGAGNVLMIRMLITPLTSPPATGVVVPMTLTASSLLSSASAQIVHTSHNGSLFVNSDGGATPVPGTPTRTQTPTITPTVPGGTVKSLKLIVCKDTEFVGNALDGRVILLDELGRVVNPGVAGGANPVEVTMNLTGGGRFANNVQPEIVQMLNQPDGLKFQFRGTLPETVTLTATAPGLDSAVPVQVEFILGGGIRGTITAMGGPIVTTDVRVDILESSTGNFVSSAFVLFNMGNTIYISRVLPAGSYDVSFVSTSASNPLAGTCVKGVTVVAGQAVENVDADLQERTGGVRVYGQVTAKGGHLLLSSSLFFYSGGVLQCGGTQLQTTTILGTPVPAIDYEFTNVPSGSYIVYGGGSGGAVGLALPTAGVPINVGNSDMEMNFEMTPLYNVAMLSPVGYARTTPVPTFEWEYSDATSGMPFQVILSGLCGQVWQKTGITGTSVVYDGPALNRSDIYTWSLSGEMPDGSVRSFGFSLTPASFVIN